MIVSWCSVFFFFNFSSVSVSNAFSVTQQSNMLFRSKESANLLNIHNREHFIASGFSDYVFVLNSRFARCFGIVLFKHKRVKGFLFLLGTN